MKIYQILVALMVAVMLYSVPAAVAEERFLSDGVEAGMYRETPPNPELAEMLGAVSVDRFLRPRYGFLAFAYHSLRGLMFEEILTSEQHWSILDRVRARAEEERYSYFAAPFSRWEPEGKYRLLKTVLLAEQGFIQIVGDEFWVTGWLDVQRLAEDVVPVILHDTEAEGSPAFSPSFPSIFDE